MTPHSRKANAADERAKGEERLAVADHLAAEGKHLDAVERLYYAPFHMARAALFTLGLEPKSHKVKTGRLPSRLAHVFSTLKSQRENADYTTEWVFTSEDWAEVRPRAEELLASLRQIVREAGVA